MKAARAAGAGKTTGAAGKPGGGRTSGGAAAPPRRRTAYRSRTVDAAAGADPDSGSGGGPEERARPGRFGPRLRRRRALALLLLLAVPLGGFGTWVLYGSPWLRLRNVSVTGTRVLSEADVSRAAAAPEGAPLITVDRAALQDRVRRALPRVREVAAERSWPHGLTLTVTERRPALVMEKADDYVEVDSEGVRFATAGKPPKGVPLLVLAPRRAADERYFSSGRLRREAARATAALPESVRRATRTVRVRSFDDITLELTGDRTVRWGSAERGRAKAAALTALMKAAEDATHFDVTAPSAPAASDS
ncbi:cell division protein FtsQ/DivIB [Streptomyces sp. NPDC007025]|uniref:cell division protein FtsQ/DivIB n=1 Tax=Streptomyces sp. NPDC007025 TaxID=3364771 RepID=UPI0036CADF59